MVTQSNKRKLQTSKKKDIGIETNQLELKNVGTVLRLGPGLDGGVLVPQESIVQVSHGGAIKTKLGFYQESEFWVPDNEDQKHKWV